MNKFLTLLICVLVPIPALSSCSEPESSDSPLGQGSGETAPLEGARIGSDFVLTDQDGVAFDSASLAGKYRIIYFGYSYCPDVCPVDLQKLMAGLRQFEQAHPDRAEKIQPIFITVDPERDTPEVLKQYTAAFHPRLIGLTGTPDQIKDVAGKYLVVYRKQDRPEMTEYLVDHSRQAYLLGPEGEPIALLPYDATPKAIAEEIDRWSG